MGKTFFMSDCVVLAIKKPESAAPAINPFLIFMLLGLQVMAFKLAMRTRVISVEAKATTSILFSNGKRLIILCKLYVSPMT